VPGDVICGFYGKIPARGDFVRFGLPRDFTDPWDAWLQSVMSGSQTLMGDDWLPAFLEAPVWRLILPPGMCGSLAALGLMLPSVDRAGRYFPLTFGALSPHCVARESAAAWLDSCEAAGLAALERDSTPDEMAAMLASTEALDMTADPDEALWWSGGSTRVEPACLTLRGLPDALTYAAMLGARTEDTDMRGAPMPKEGRASE
jgi:type VI secretion system protein ImpM